MSAPKRFSSSMELDFEFYAPFYFTTADATHATADGKKRLGLNRVEDVPPDC